MKRVQLFLGCCLILYCGPPVEARAAVKSSETCDLVIYNVTLFDGKRVTEHANVYVKGHIVTQINANKRIATTPCKVSVDGTGKTLIPGLINAHIHPDSPAHLREAAQAGVLTLLDLFAADESRMPQLKSLANSPQYAYYYTCGFGADTPGGVIASTKAGLSIPHPTDIGTAKELIKTRITNGADFIKIFQDSGSRRITPFTDSLLESLIAETHRHGKVVTVHIGTLKDARLAFGKGADILAHLWRGQDGTATEADLKSWRKRRFYITPTLLPYKIVKPNAPRLYPVPFNTYITEVGRLHKANIPILAGSDADSSLPGINMGTDFYKELEMFVQAGMTPLEALQTATTNPAKAFRLRGRGVIKRGITADFVLVNGDVINNIKDLNKVESIWKHGVKIR